jgi:hypothetical protein
MTSEPWAHTAGFGDPRPPNIAPGWLAAAQRAEAAERAREQRETDERTARAQDRFDRWQWQRMQEMAWRGQPFDPNDVRTLARTPEQIANEVFGPPGHRGGSQRAQGPHRGRATARPRSRLARAVADPGSAARARQPGVGVTGDGGGEQDPGRVHPMGAPQQHLL